MRSQLTRSVFRRLLSNEGLTFHCPTQFALRPRPRYVSHNLFRGLQRRTFLGFSAKPERKPKDAEFVPGFEKMCELGAMVKIGARPPPAENLMRAWRVFFQYKITKNEAINELQAAHVLRTFDHLRELRNEDGEPMMKPDDIFMCRKALLKIPMGKVENHRAIAHAIYQEFQRRGDWNTSHTQAFVELFTQIGDTAEAKILAQRDYGEVFTSESEAKKYYHIWRAILSGFAKESSEAELVATAENMNSLGLPSGKEIQSIMTCFYASKNDVMGTKEWYERQDWKNRSVTPAPETLAAILKFSIRNNELEWCKECFRNVIEVGPQKEHWDVILQWAAGTMGKGVEDVERMMKIMGRHSSGEEQMKPDIVTINGLVDLAMSRQDPYLAERYIALGLKSGIHPNAKTFILQMNYRVDAGDLSGAQSAYMSLQSEEITENEDLTVINKYIRALCGKPSNYERIVTMLSDLDARKARLEADTVKTVAMMYMERDELQDVYDILQTNTYHYTLGERARIRDAFLAFCFDRNNSNARAWNSYQVLRQIFDETDTTIRTKLMNEFFDRERSDMACYVFGHMRQHAHADRRPTLETYIQCFEGIARCEDRESLDIVHNMFKMDSNMEPNTKLYNSLMLAYTSVEDGDRALDFWDDITNSIEGPSYRSLEIVFRACQVTPFGDGPARDIWSKMRRMEIEVTRDVFVAYVGAIAGRGRFEEARDLVDTGGKEFGLKPDLMTIGVFYNALPGRSRKDQVEEWARGTYPEVWAELEKVGQTQHEEGWMMFNIKRKMKA